MGSFPGPACYGLGGDQATLTDAFVTAGLINPEYFLGGTKPIDRDLAQSVIENQVAKPMNISMDEACRLIIDRAFELVADLIATRSEGSETGSLEAHAFRVRRQRRPLRLRRSRKSRNQQRSALLARSSLQRIRLVRLGYLPRVRTRASRTSQFPMKMPAIRKQSSKK